MGWIQLVGTVVSCGFVRGAVGIVDIRALIVGRRSPGEPVLLGHVFPLSNVQILAGGAVASSLSRCVHSQRRGTSSRFD